MTKEELTIGLENLKFKNWYDDEFHRHVYINDSTKVELSDNRYVKVNLELYVDYYTLRIIWWLEKGKKVTKSYYMKREVEKIACMNELLSLFVTQCSMDYGVDLHKYTFNE